MLILELITHVASGHFKQPSEPSGFIKHRDYGGNNKYYSSRIVPKTKVKSDKKIDNIIVE